MRPPGRKFLQLLEGLTHTGADSLDGYSSFRSLEPATLAAKEPNVKMILWVPPWTVSAVPTPNHRSVRSIKLLSRRTGAFPARPPSPCKRCAPREAEKRQTCRRTKLSWDARCSSAREAAPCTPWNLLTCSLRQRSSRDCRKNCRCRQVVRSGAFFGGRATRN